MFLKVNRTGKGMGITKAWMFSFIRLFLYKANPTWIIIEGRVESWREELEIMLWWVESASIKGAASCGPLSWSLTEWWLHCSVHIILGNLSFRITKWEQWYWEIMRFKKSYENPSVGRKWWWRTLSKIIFYLLFSNL